MSEHRVKLTKRLVDDLKAGPKERFLWDSEVLGFGLRISTAGSITYVLQYRFEGRQRRFKIGLHGSPWTPETARQEARSLQGKIVDGIDPQQARMSGVSATGAPRRRSNKSAPTISSSRAIAWLTAGCVLPSCLAAAAKLRVSTTLRKVSS